MSLRLVFAVVDMDMDMRMSLGLGLGLGWVISFELRDCFFCLLELCGNDPLFVAHSLALKVACTRLSYVMSAIEFERLVYPCY